MSDSGARAREIVRKWEEAYSDEGMPMVLGGDLVDPDTDTMIADIALALTRARQDGERAGLERAAKIAQTRFDSDFDAGYVNGGQIIASSIRAAARSPEDAP